MPNSLILSAVLGLLAERDYRPSELIAVLKELGFTQADAKEAMSHLVHGQQVELTEDRVLRSAVPA